MADDVPPPVDPTVPVLKGLLWGNRFSSAGLPDEVRAILAGALWVTTNGGSTSWSAWWRSRGRELSSAGV